MWSGWIAINDKEKSKVYVKLVNSSSSIIKNFPWDKSLDKKKFIQPDFSSLEILTFAGDRLPSGINIPNYYDIRENFGFKNVVFQDKNDARKVDHDPSKNATFNFTLLHMKDKAESDQFNNYQTRAYMVQVAGHELFGHGSGRLIYRNTTTGKCPLSLAAPINPDKKIESCYEKDETYSSKFKDIGTSFEECRADLAGLWLQNFEEMWKHFNWTKEAAPTYRWASLL